MGFTEAEASFQLISKVRPTLCANGICSLSVLSHVPEVATGFSPQGLGRFEVGLADHLLRW